MINKELLSAVGMSESSSYNIYELAHLCKKWAFNQDERYIINSSICESGKYHAEVSIFRNGLGHIFRTAATSLENEPEAIFKVCEWILNQELVK